jgi:serine protease inhibitor
MTCDHAFLYAIRDDDSGLLLFIGALANPAASQ